ncbi:Flagellar hook-length control protein FliK [Halopseudomonas litoralis]|uniref:Flagellar hook-length control protein FliK n=1 Tax=Halopseudomonas litoralis TaxID=797277 RepID=A0A1H1N2I1_9GAMM|nr:flagellar hook-length control protein FliK [Halopseudomonas litoralis]SDR93117.1 Flagellar hook-length control protein FliK [Halopseudomonas litoralis]
MSASQPLMALMSTDVRSAARVDNVRAASPADSQGDFAGLLAEQLPAELESALNQLNPEQRDALEQAALAADGKTLPPQLQDWLEHLPLDDDAAEQTGESALGVIGQWMQWLQESASPNAGQPQASAAAGTTTHTLGGREAVGGMQVTVDGETADPDMDSGQGGRELSAREQLDRQPASREQPLTNDLNRPSRQTANAQQNVQQDFSAALQRAAGTHADSQALPSAMLGKLAEQLERASTNRGSGETDAIDGLARPGSYSAAAAALTARPVAAPTQAMGVPFGQPSWGEAMVEKVMWMSSQNLRSVEIQLDPAELGPLEIHIQQRGQELQVQFVSQNPSVREALEAQMHRLRDMFGQQGMEQAEVTVADRSAGEQSRQGDGQSAERSAAQAQDRSTLSVGNKDDVLEQPALTTQWSPVQRLVDYYI